MKQNSNTLRFIATVLAAIVVLVASFVAPSSTAFASSNADTYTPTIPVVTPLDCTVADLQVGEVKFCQAGVTFGGDIMVSTNGADWVENYHLENGQGAVSFLTEAMYVKAVRGPVGASARTPQDAWTEMLADGCGDLNKGCDSVAVYRNGSPYRLVLDQATTLTAIATDVLGQPRITLYFSVNRSFWIIAKNETTGQAFPIAYTDGGSSGWMSFTGKISGIVSEGDEMPIDRGVTYTFTMVNASDYSAGPGCFVMAETSVMPLYRFFLPGTQR